MSNQNRIKLWVGIGSSVMSGVVAGVAATAMASPVTNEPLSPAPLQPEPNLSESNLSESNLSGAGSFELAQAGEEGEGGGSYAAYDDKLSGDELLAALQAGGHVIFFRHAQTDEDYADQADPNLDLSNCGTQRTLSEQGWQDAKTIGAGFEAAQIPVGEVYSSEYCRAWQTADLAFGQYEKAADLNFAPAEEYTEEQVAQMREGLLPYLTTVPAAGTNTVIVGHDDVFDAVTGIYPDPQGIAFIVTPDGNGEFEIVADLLPQEWGQLAQ